jgi:membrane carboxypeptidase/penicillin-binding protein PbpC
MGGTSVNLFLDNVLLTDGETTGIPLADTGTCTVSIAGGTYTVINWYLNGALLSQASMEQSIVLSKQRTGTYLVTVEVQTAGGEKNSGSHTFVVR